VLLAEAFEKASALRKNLQDELARQVLKELVGEAGWGQALAESGEAFDKRARP
jgi:hypothetical protein